MPWSLQTTSKSAQLSFRFTKPLLLVEYMSKGPPVHHGMAACVAFPVNSRLAAGLLRGPGLAPVAASFKSESEAFLYPLSLILRYCDDNMLL